MKLLIILIVFLLSILSVSPVLAADPPGIVVDITVIGDKPQTGVKIEGDQPLTGVFIDGQNPTTLIDLDGANSHLYINGHDINDTVGSAISSGISSGVQQATPNSQWSGASTGMLPPLGLIPEVNAVAPGKYTQPYVGWMGYFCPTSNTNPYVYKGAGCGGAWGVADGWPDLWGRRQIAGIAVDFTIQKEKLLQAQTALVKVIGELKSKGDSIEGINARLDVSLDTLSGVVTDLSVLEEENLQFREQTTKQINDLYNMLIFLIVLVIIIVLAAIIGFTILVKSRNLY